MWRKKPKKTPPMTDNGQLTDHGVIAHGTDYARRGAV